MKSNINKTSTLGEVVEFLDSQRRPVKAAERNPGPYPYYGANGQQGTIDGFLFDEPLVLLAEDGGHFFEPARGIAYKIEGKTWVNNHAHVLRPKPSVDIDYLCLLLKHMNVTRYLTGTTRAKLTKAGACRIKVPLPPLAEQKRIAGILDAADALRVKRHESLAQLDTLLQSIFLDMFGNPVTNPMGWEVKELAEAVSVQGGFAFKSKDYCKQGVRLVKISNVHSANLKWDEIDRVPDAYLKRYKDFALEPGDLVIALTRPIIKSLDSVKIATVGPMDAPSLLNQRVARFVFSPNSTIDNSYLLAFCRTQFFKNAVQRFCSESLQPNMSTKQLGRVLIAHPPLDLQHRFSAIVESVEQQKARQLAHLTELDTLFASLQQRAFNEELSA